MSSQPKPKTKTKALADLLQRSGATSSDGKKKKPARRRPVAAPADEKIETRSISFTPAALVVLDGFVEQLSRPGRTASRSGVVRALLRCADKREAQQKLIEELDREMTAELRTGEVVWGSRPGESK